LFRVARIWLSVDQSPKPRFLMPPSSTSSGFANEAPPETRLAIYERSGDGKALLALLSQTNGAAGTEFNLSGDSSETIERVQTALREARAEARANQESGGADSLASLAKILTDRGFLVEEIPAADNSFNLEYNFNTGHMVASQQVLNPYAKPGDDIGPRIYAAMCSCPGGYHWLSS
jgi:hypothetical protein